MARKWHVIHHLKDKADITYIYQYSPSLGVLISIFVGYLSPLLGIGGGIIHVPALINWLNFPVFVATATSHFILAIMSVVSVITHYLNGNYNNPFIIRIVVLLCIGALFGAQLGAYLSHRIKGHVIVKALAVCLCIVGIKMLLN